MQESMKAHLVVAPPPDIPLGPVAKQLSIGYVILVVSDPRRSIRWYVTPCPALGSDGLNLGLGATFKRSCRPAVSFG